MPNRAILTVAALCALLVLGAGFGSVLMLSGTWQVGKQTRVASSETRVASSETRVASNQNHSLLATHTAPGDARSVPTMPRAIASKPTFAATETRIVLMDSVLSPRSSTLPTYTPFAISTPEPTGGPVPLPNNHKGTRWVTLQAG